MSQVYDASRWEPRFERFLAEHTTAADPAHDLAHVRRVVATAKQLAELEGARLEIVIPAAWLHDCVTVRKDSPDRAAASAAAARATAVFLADAAYPADLIPEIRHAVEAHSFSAGIMPRTLEAEVVQDADRLDALGAVGIARCVMVGSQLGLALYNPVEPLPATREPDDSAFIVDHFYLKLLKLAATMRTAAGRAEAERRSRFMEDFLEQLRGEAEGGIRE